TGRRLFEPLSLSRKTLVAVSALTRKRIRATLGSSSATTRISSGKFLLVTRFHHRLPWRNWKSSWPNRAGGIKLTGCKPVAVYVFTRRENSTACAGLSAACFRHWQNGGESLRHCFGRRFRFA